MSKKTTTEMEIKVSNGRIISAELMPNGKAKLIVELPATEVKTTEKCMFVLVEASKLRLEDKFMRYNPQSERSKEFKRLLTEVINKGIKDFYRPVMDPYASKDGDFFYEAGNKPAVGHSYDWWKKKAMEFDPDRGSRLGTRYEYVAFLGVLIKSLVESGWKTADAWKAICDDSNELGHYWNSENAKHSFETTGSREVFGFYDLTNTYKILAENEDEEAGGFWLAGGSYINYSFNYPLADLSHRSNRNGNYDFSVGWLVLS